MGWLSLGCFLWAINESVQGEGEEITLERHFLCCSLCWSKAGKLPLTSLAHGKPRGCFDVPGEVLGAA